MAAYSTDETNKHLTIDPEATPGKSNNYSLFTPTHLKPLRKQKSRHNSITSQSIPATDIKNLLSKEMDSQNLGRPVGHCVTALQMKESINIDRDDPSRISWASSVDVLPQKQHI
jgi:hypothetical protein